MTLDENGLHADRPNAITTWTGRRVEPLNMRYDDFDILDIAHALSRLCRYNGHTGGFYSVARHSLFVADAVVDAGRSDLQLDALLHDAAEAYMGDLVRPLKHADELSQFRKYDSLLDAAVAERFELSYPQNAVVTAADRAVLVEDELPYPHGLRWTWDSTPEEDERDFLHRYAELTGDFHLLERPSRRTHVIGLSGYAQAGKDTAARVLAEHFSFHRVAFADTLREMLYALNPLIKYLPKGAHQTQPLHFRLQALVDNQGWDAVKTTYPEVRELLQRLGTEAGREVLGDNIWVDAAMRKIDRLRAAGSERFVFTDVRFPNEYQAIKDAGGEVWRIERPDTKAVNRHISETALDQHQFDRYIYNSAGVLEFDRKIHVCAAALFRPGRVAAT